MLMLTDGKVSTALPCQDFERAKAWYKEHLGLAPSDENPAGANYVLGEGSFFLFQSSGAPSGTHTQMGFEVKDLKAEVADLKRMGVVFEEYDFPGLKTVDGIAEIEGESAAWFKDSEGNLIALSTPVSG
jgi:catechol 2,3-dioxygenase-like lactoylglutathione lyase family enzyme